ncbi:unnamed protein product [Symbiodinium necroappetens]|uniref:Reverse transcriptase domain-containing protein n=1 Tax=Symbiodinium necroappetens TaxID=1628268 RepID=A0A812U5F4_9DINO|nr:unnamed protein product [Symbiodinium necroappetens]
MGGGTAGGMPWEARAWLGLLEAREMQVAGGNTLTSIPQSNGVRQGSPDSPILFSRIVADCLEEATRETQYMLTSAKGPPPPQSGGAFMDDMYIWSHDHAHLQATLASLERRLARHGLLIREDGDHIQPTCWGGALRIGGEAVSCKPFGEVITALGSPLTFGESSAAIVAEMNHRARKAFGKHSRLLCAPSPIRERIKLHQTLVRGSALWGGQSWPVTDGILKAINTTQLLQVRRMMCPNRRPGERWEEWHVRTMRGARVALHQSKILRWSTFQLQHTWDLYGHMARAEAGGRPMLTWKDVSWWEVEKAKPRRERHTHVKFNPLADPERQLVAIAGVGWKELARDFKEWGEKGGQFVERFDVPPGGTPPAPPLPQQQQQGPTLQLRSSNLPAEDTDPDQTEGTAAADKPASSSTAAAATDGPAATDPHQAAAATQPEANTAPTQSSTSHQQQADHGPAGNTPEPQQQTGETGTALGGHANPLPFGEATVPSQQQPAMATQQSQAHSSAATTPPTGTGPTGAQQYQHQQPPAAAAHTQRGVPQTEAQHPASSSHEQPPQRGDSTNPPRPNKGEDTSPPAAGGGTNSAKGGIPPDQELEEAPSKGLSGGPDKPYHEGRGDQRMRGKRFKAAVQQAFAQRGWDKREDQTWKQVAYMVDLYEEDDEEVWAKVLAAGPQRRPRRGQQQQPAPAGDQGGIDWGLLLNLHTLPRGTVGATPTQQHQRPSTAAAQTKHAAAGEPQGDPRRRREASSSTQAPQQHDEDTSMWDGIFHVMLLSHGGATRPLTFPPELFIERGAEAHLRSFPYGVWAGVVMVKNSRRAPSYNDPSRGFYRVRLSRREGGEDPPGYIAVGTAFALFPWGAITNGKPVKWLVHITSTPAQPDSDATELPVGTSYTLERKGGTGGWGLGRLPPKLALQYFYDWGNMRGTGAIYWGLPRTWSLPPIHWEQLTAQLIPSPNQARHPALNPTFDHTQGGQHGPAPNPPPAPPPSPTQPQPQPQQQGEQQPQRGAASTTATSPTQSDTQQTEGEETQLMQRTQLDDSAATSSHGESLFQRPRPRRMPNAAAMVRHWLRKLAAVLSQRSPGDNVHVLLEQASQAVGRSKAEPEACDNGSLAGGPSKKRRIMNSISVARMRLQDLTEEDDVDGLNAHQIRHDLEQATYDLAVGEKLLQHATTNQWGFQVQQSLQGLAQAQAAVQTAISATVQGDLDWHVPGWGQAVVVLMEDAEQLLEEEGQLDFVHPADVAALSEGAQETPPTPLGSWGQQLDELIRNIGGVMAFVTEGHAEVRQLLAAIQVWRAKDRPDEVVEIETQTTDQGEGAPPTDEVQPWKPPLEVEQWPGSIPSSANEGDTQTSEPGFPTDGDLLDALEEYEQQEQREDRKLC